MAALLKVLVKVRITDDLSILKETDTPNKKGKAGDVRVTDEPLLLDMTRKYRNKEVIARKTNSLIFPGNNLVPTSIPNSVNANRYFDLFLYLSVLSNSVITCLTLSA